MLLRKMFCGILLITDKTPTFTDKFLYYLANLFTLAPIVFILNQMSIWFSMNRKFATLVILVLLVNLVVGAWYHLKMGSFTIEEFIVKNCVMLAILLLAYILLESLALNVGSNIATEGFRVMIQLSTLLYPSSKALKNLYILSNKEYPPAFIMEKLYKFEKTGDITEFYKTTFKTTIADTITTTTNTTTNEIK